MSGFNTRHPMILRDEAFKRLFQLKWNGQRIKSGRKVPVVTVQNDQVPALGVYILGVKSPQLGNASIRQFEETVELGIALTVMGTDDLYLKCGLDSFAIAARDRLLRDDTFCELFEYVTSMSQEYAFPKDGEAYQAELRLRMNLFYRVMYEPWAPYNFNLVDVKYQPPSESAPLLEQQDWVWDIELAVNTTEANDTVSATATVH